MKKLLILVITILIIYQSCDTINELPLSKKVEIDSACAEELSDYEHFSLLLKNDTINYHTYQKTEIDSIKNILVYVQGSGSSPLFKVKREGKSRWIAGSVPFDLSQIPNDYLFVIISKKGIPFCTQLDKDYVAPKIYYKNETLEYRTEQVNLVIKDILVKHIRSTISRIAVIGHSEGSSVIAKLGTINENVSHFGYWCGTGNSQWYDSALSTWKQVNRNEISEREAIIKMDSMFSIYKDITENKNNINKQWMGNSYRRWYHFSEPPIENLLKIDKPIFAIIGAADRSVAVEGMYLIPIEFIRKGKDNLSFKVYPNLDHNLDSLSQSGVRTSHWNKVFLEFLKWVEEN